MQIFCLCFFFFSFAEEVCGLELADGVDGKMCLGYFPSYYYNRETGECEEFIYGGCGGNENRFDTKQECEDFCVN